MFEKSTADARPDPHRCIAASRCRSTTGPLAALTEQPGTLCEPCLTALANAIKQLPADWEELRRALGERRTTDSAAVKSTPTPAAPINVTRAALMSDIVDRAQSAAEIVSDQLGIDPPTGRRNTAPPILVNGNETRPKPDTPAWTAETAVTPDALQSLRAYLAIIEPHIDKLAAAGDTVLNTWNETSEDRKRELVETTGLDIALDLADTHHRTRAELGKTRLRHKYGFPCPRCGAELGRDDGTNIVDCKGESCRASWTEREFKFLQGLELEGREKEISKWLLTEAYTRLDGLTSVIHTLESDEQLRDIEAVKIILTALKPHLDGHTPAHDREIATDNNATKQRQLEEDNWSWRNETPYRPPKRKKAKPKPPPEITYTKSSLALDAPIHLPRPEDRRDKACRQCNMIHAGDCIA